MNVHIKRIRAVCDHLETVPGELYDFYKPRTDGRCPGCVTAHGIAAGLIPKNLIRDYDRAVTWLTGKGFMSAAFEAGGDDSILPIGKGEDAKQAAIKALRNYATKLEVTG